MNVYAFTWIYVNLCEVIWIHMNTKQLHINVYEIRWIYLNISMILFNLWFQMFWFIPNLHELMQMNILNLFENMLTAGLPHTAAPLDSRTLPRALPDSRTLPHTLPDSRTQLRALPHTLPHCRTLYKLKCYTPYSAHSRTLHTVASHRNQHELKQFDVNVIYQCNMHLQEFMWIYVNLCLI